VLLVASCGGGGSRENRSVAALTPPGRRRGRSQQTHCAARQLTSSFFRGSDRDGPHQLSLPPQAIAGLPLRLVHVCITSAAPHPQHRTHSRQHHEHEKRVDAHRSPLGGLDGCRPVGKWLCIRTRRQATVAAAPTPLGNAAAAVTGTFGQLTSSSFLRSSVAVQEVSILFLVAVRRVKPLAPRKDKGGNRLQFLRHSDWSDSRQRDPSCLSNSRPPMTETVRIGSRCVANADLRPQLSSPQRKTEPQVPLRQENRRSVRMRRDKEHHAQGSLHVCSSWSQHGMKFCARLTQRRYLEYTLTGS